VCTFSCAAGYLACGNACCADCRIAGNTCAGVTWCQPSGLCEAVQKIEAPVAEARNNDELGQYVALDGTSVLAAAPGRNFAVGTAYVFDRTGGSPWAPVGTALQPDAGSHYFGSSVAIVGDRAAVGAPAEASSTGAVYLFERPSGGVFPSTAGLKWTGEASVDNFGAAVALGATRLVVGASKGDGPAMDSGAVYIFERQSDGSWPATGVKLTASDGKTNDGFGAALSLSGDRLLVGAASASVGTNRFGAAYLFDRQPDGSWHETQKLVAGSGSQGDLFATSLALDGDRAIVGAPYDDDRGTNAGAAYVYERQPTGTWMPTAKLYSPPPNAGPGDYFGSAVALAGDVALVGAPHEDGTPGTAGTVGLGAAYLFKHQSNGTWATGIAVPTDPADVRAQRSYGIAVALSSTYAVVGADTDQTSIGVTSGTAYVTVLSSLLP
jgi:hypothetical protein